MPSYVYRCKGDCGYLKVLQPLSAAPLTACPQCEKETRRAIVAGNLAQVNTYLPSTDLGYFPGLARFHGDPEAHISGPDSLNRIMDKRKRMGWTISKTDDAPLDPASDLKKAAETKRKADFFKATGVEI